MSFVLYIDDLQRTLMNSTATALLKKGHQVQLVKWDRGLFKEYLGKIKGLSPANFIAQVNPEVLIIHFGKNLTNEEAKKVVDQIRRECPDILIIVILDDAQNTFGADYCIQIPYHSYELTVLIR